MSANDSWPNVLIFDDPELVAQAAANRFVELAQIAVQARGRFSVALAGGSTPKRLYELLASESFQNRVAWGQTHIFFGDERCVPPTHAESNYRMAHDALLYRVPIPETNVHRIIGEGDAAANARHYWSELERFFVGEPGPRCDLILLGLGDDGHTASLFPGTEAVREQSAWVVANAVPQLAAFRITLTAPAINHAAHVIFLVTGASKARAVAAVLRGAPEPEKYPAQLIRPTGGAVEWLLDRAAAAELQER